MSKYEDAKYRIDNILEQLSSTCFFDFINTSMTDDHGDLCEEFYKYHPFGIFNSHMTNVRDFVDGVDLPDTLQWSAGASRVVFWDYEEPDFVLKIAINRRCEKYNTNEVEIFEKVKEVGAEEAFAWMDCIYPAGTELPNGVVIDRGIYAMEYADCDEDVISSMTSSAAWADYCYYNGIDPNDEKEKENFLDGYWSDYDYNDDIVIDFAIEKMWTDTLGRKVRDIIDDFHINDLHDGNFGLIHDNFVIVDYAGWGH